MSFEPWRKKLIKVSAEADAVGKAWSGGLVGYQSRVYKTGLRRIAPGEFFNTTYGFDLPDESVGEWTEYDFDQLFKRIVGKVDLTATAHVAAQIGIQFERRRDEVVAILAAVSGDDEFLVAARGRIENLSSHESVEDHVRAEIGQREVRTGDRRASRDTIQSPPHIAVQANISSQASYAAAVTQLANEIERAARYVVARRKHPPLTALVDPIPPETTFEIECMDVAIAEARNCKNEDGKISPKVGAVIVQDGSVIAKAYRGQLNPGDHAEYRALEDLRSRGVSAAGATVFTTLEPCTSRNAPKLPCAERLIEHRVAEVWIGVLDPDDRIRGNGELRLREAGIRVRRFPPERMARIEELNQEFSRDRRGKTT